MIVERFFMGSALYMQFISSEIPAPQSVLRYVLRPDSLVCRPENGNRSTNHQERIYSHVRHPALRSQIKVEQVQAEMRDVVLNT